MVVLMDVEVARVLSLGLAGGDGTQRRAAEESHLDVLREAIDAEEPALALDSVKRRVPFDRLAHAGDGAHDERVEAAPDVTFPARHGRDVGLHGGVAVGLRDLRVAACEDGRLRYRADLPFSAFPPLVVHVFCLLRFRLFSFSLRLVTSARLCRATR